MDYLHEHFQDTILKQNYSHAILGPEFKRKEHLKIMGTAKMQSFSEISQ